MLISGFTFIKNGISLGYPFIESIKSIEPICDEIIINVGFENTELNEDDGTFKILQKTFPPGRNSKYKYIKSFWDPKKKIDGLVLSEQTNIALKNCKGDFCFYIQGDEAVSENDLPKIRKEVKALKEKDKHIDALVFNYTHFYGNVDIIRHTRTTYRREIRIIRNHKNILSWKDAQGFRYKNEEKIPAKQISAQIYHYGWARKEEIMESKINSFNKLFHGDDVKGEEFSYQRVWGLKKFKGSHPKVMETWISKNKNELDIMSYPLKWEKSTLRMMISDLIESLTGYRMGEFKNFKLIK